MASPRSAIGAPASTARLPAALTWSGPKLFISGTADVYGGVEQVEAYVSGLPPPKRLCWLAGADHFLTNRAAEYDRVIRDNLDFA